MLHQDLENPLFRIDLHQLVQERRGGQPLLLDQPEPAQEIGHLFPAVASQVFVLQDPGDEKLFEEPGLQQVEFALFPSRLRIISSEILTFSMKASWLMTEEVES